MRLQKALADCQSVQESLDGLLKWLEDKEKALLRMEKGTVIVVKKEPLVENLQEYRVSRGLGCFYNNLEIIGFVNKLVHTLFPLILVLQLGCLESCRFQRLMF